MWVRAGTRGSSVRNVPWNNVVPVIIGGVVAVGFLDGERVLVGSHSALGVFDSRTGDRLERTPSDDYSWCEPDPPSIRYAGGSDVRLVAAEGLWGGELDRVTADGWACRLRTDGAQLFAEGNPHTVRVHDPEERRAFGFSPDGQTFIYATSETLTLLRR